MKIIVIKQLNDYNETIMTERRALPVTNIITANKTALYLSMY